VKSQSRLFLLAVLVYTAGACAPKAVPLATQPAPPSVVDTVVVVDTVRVETEASADAELQTQVARLQIQLLERDVRLEGMQEQLDATRQEVVRNLAKLQSQASRAEAASGMAEAEIALQALGRVQGGTNLPEFDEAQSRIGESTAEFGTENYGGALYLATQARALVRTGQSRLRGAGASSLLAGESLFAVPVPLETVQRTNVRSGPGLTFDVQFTLDEAAAVVGHSYTSQWVRVVDEQGREGWVFHTLVKGRAR